MAIDPVQTTKVLAEIAEMDHSQAKGKRLEDLMKSIFQQVPGLNFDSSNVQNFYQTEEMDLLFWNDAFPEGLHFLDCPLVIECKSSSSAVDGKALSYFATTLRHKGCRSGVLVALSGLTGNPAKSTAGFFHQTAALIDGVRVLVVTADDLKTLSSGDDMVRLLKRVQLDLVRRQVQTIEASAS